MTSTTPVVPIDYKTIKTNNKEDDKFRVYSADEDTPARVIEHYRGSA
eukprot:CAMPEP_0116042920 /NCGR_PEP_ID=MMETSP0321-20121206/26013_1 /TAXON_ID=163516 /ORGANISM="Leptocylindrus danicus var. danicus, Strain B650" /LENGTH=46 /DNA_ID= /DNA_START= /DNA_END= /DNA_ORIENTATION=